MILKKLEALTVSRTDYRIIYYRQKNSVLKPIVYYFFFSLDHRRVLDRVESPNCHFASLARVPYEGFECV